jgi:hypothetical protein|tara:strand:+ start:397 stop:582 length:186 start_codon:yes stop_codon:yes gene_type:complete
MTLVHDLILVEVLEQEIEHYKTLIEPQDCGHIHTTIGFLQSRISNLKGKKEWPFDKSNTSM